MENGGNTEQKQRPLNSMSVWDSLHLPKRSKQTPESQEKSHNVGLSWLQGRVYLTGGLLTALPRTL